MINPLPTAEEAIQFVVEELGNLHSVMFLQDYQDGEADEWPDFVDWLAGKRG